MECPVIECETIKHTLTGFIKVPLWHVLKINTPNRDPKIPSMLGEHYLRSRHSIQISQCYLQRELSFWKWLLLEKLWIFLPIDVKLNEKVMHSRMLGLLAFDWNAWMGSRMDYFAEMTKTKNTHSIQGLLYLCIVSMKFLLY